MTTKWARQAHHCSSRAFKSTGALLPFWLKFVGQYFREPGDRGWSLHPKETVEILHCLFVCLFFTPGETTYSEKTCRKQAQICSQLSFCFCRHTFVRGSLGSNTRYQSAQPLRASSGSLWASCVRLSFNAHCPEVWFKLDAEDIVAELQSVVSRWFAVVYLAPTGKRSLMTFHLTSLTFQSFSYLPLFHPCTFEKSSLMLCILLQELQFTVCSWSIKWTLYTENIICGEYGPHKMSVWHGGLFSYLA